MFKINRYDVMMAVLSVTGKLKLSLHINGISHFDKALDTVYNATHIGGGNHRLFDGGHTLIGAWKQIQTIDVSLPKKIQGYTGALINDFTTPNGLPVKTISQQTYNALCDIIPCSRAQVYDLLTFDVTDILPTFYSASLFVKAIKSNNGDKSIIYGMSSTAIYCLTNTSGIPILLSISTAAIGIVKDIKNGKVKEAVKSTTKVSLTITIAGTIAIFTNPFIAITTGIIALKLLDNVKLLKRNTYILQHSNDK